MTTETEEQLVDLEDCGAYAIMRMNRPDKRNAMNRAMREAMLKALEKCRGKYNVVVLVGTETSFCAGIDLKEIRADRAAGKSADHRFGWNEVLLAIRQHPAIFIAAVNGTALGGGSTLINVCDLAIAGEDVQIGMPEMGFATYPGLAGPAAQLSMARKHAAYMILTAKRINGKQAEKWALVNKAVPLNDLLSEVKDLASHIAQFDAAALSESKRALDYVPSVITEWRQMFEYGAKVNAQIRAKSSAQNEGMARFAKGERNIGQGR